MVGLVTQATTPEAAPAAGEAPAPEGQEAYDSALKMAGEMLYNDDTSSAKFMGMLSEGDPVQAVVGIVTFIIDAIEDAFQGQLPETVISPAADEITDMVLEMGEVSGAIPEVTEDVAIQFKGAVEKALIDTYGTTPEAFAEAVQSTDDATMQQAQQVFGGA
jgi:hypothetical protein